MAEVVAVVVVEEAMVVGKCTTVGVMDGATIQEHTAGLVVRGMFPVQQWITGKEEVLRVSPRAMHEKEGGRILI